MPAVYVHCPVRFNACFVGVVLQRRDAKEVFLETFIDELSVADCIPPACPTLLGLLLEELKLQCLTRVSLPEGLAGFAVLPEQERESQPRDFLLARDMPQLMHLHLPQGSLTRQCERLLARSATCYATSLGVG